MCRKDTENEQSIAKPPHWTRSTRGFAFLLSAITLKLSINNITHQGFVVYGKF